MYISTYINIEHPPLLSGILESVHRMKLAQESLCDELFMLESIHEGLADDSHA
jgi:hypothetical protein